MNIETVAEVNDPAFKTGMGKNGKQWTLAQITTDMNHVASVFMPIKVGDKVQMEWNDTYGNWSAKKVDQRGQETMEALRKLYELNTAIYKAVTGGDYNKAAPAPKPALAAPKKPVEENPYTAETGMPEPYDQNEIQLSDIPF